MKLILSRKGFDSGTGGYPSPIMPNRELVSLPIPDSDSIMSYKDLIYDSSTNYLDIIRTLYKKIKVDSERIPISNNIKCHLDPDIKKDVVLRKHDWKGAFGQIGAAQRHLENNGVSVGDIFLFFGWFRETVYKDKLLTFDSSDKEGKHIIFGYLQIGNIYKVNKESELPEWLSGHPHNAFSRRMRANNTIYTSNEHLTWNKNIAGYGTFNYNDKYVLTKKSCNRSKWELPEFFKNVNISYHNSNSWKDGYFQSVCRGQEFVIDINEEILAWLKDIIAS